MTDIYRMTLKEAQQYCTEVFGNCPHICIQRVVYENGIVSFGDYHGEMEVDSPFEKLYGTWEGVDIKNIGGFCEENRLDGTARDLMKHFEGKTGNFKTEPFFLTDALIKFNGKAMRFDGFRLLITRITK